MPIELSSEHFGEFYYSHDCGIPYERSEHWLSFFDAIAERIIKDLAPKSVLDAGCAWGFLVEALRKRGVEAYGIDISEYAISNVHESVKDYCKVGSIAEPFDRKYDLIVNIEVLEHMKPNDAIKAIENFCNSSNRVLFSSTPFDYKEVTHVNVRTPEYWVQQFARQGFFRDLDFDGTFITAWTNLFVPRSIPIDQLAFEYERNRWPMAKENYDLRQHILDNQNKIDQMEASLNQAEISLEQQKDLANASLEKAHLDAQHESNILQTSLEEANLKAQHYRNLFDSLQHESNILQTSLEEANLKAQHYRNLFDSLQGEHERIGLETQHYKNLLGIKENENESLAIQLDSLRVSVNELVLTRAKLESELFEKQRKLENDFKKLEEEIAFKQNEFDTKFSTLNHEKNLADQTVIKQRARLQEINGHWQALINSNTWKSLQKMGKFKGFPDLTTNLLTDDQVNKAKNVMVSEEIDLRPVPKDSVSEPLTIGPISIKPLSGITIGAKPGEFVSLNNDPQLILENTKGEFLSSMYELQIEMTLPNVLNTATFYYDTGKGFSELETSSFDIFKDELTKIQIFIPKNTQRIRFDPCSTPGHFEIIKFELIPITRIKILTDAASKFYGDTHNIKDALQKTKRGIDLLRSGGMNAISDRLYNQTTQNYDLWVQRFDTLTDEDRILIRKDQDALSYRPLISVVMPTYNTPEEWLRKAIGSVQEQLYENWELCIADDRSTDERVREVIREYAIRDRRIKYTFRDTNGHISNSSNSALDMVEGEFVALLDHDDQLNEAALYHVVRVLNENPDLDVVYSDEDKIDEDGKRYDPYFKPDWMPDLYVSQNFTSHLSVYRKTVIDQVGGFRVGYEGAQDWDLMMRISEAIPASRIKHIPRVLYHWRAIHGSTAKAKSEKSYVEIAQEKTILDHFQRMEIDADISPDCHGFWRTRYNLGEDFPKVSLIIPTKDKAVLLRQCVESIQKNTSYPDFEILVVDNNSSEQETFDLFEEFASNEWARIISYPGKFNFSAINNYAVEQAQGKVVVLLNNDTEVISSDWLEEMVSLAIRPETGAVGAKLYYPDDTIQHAGVVLGIMGVANHAYLHQPKTTPGQMGRAMLTQNYSAVTGACLAVEKSKYLEVGGLNEISLTVAFNDIDFCLKLLQAGYRNVWTPYAELYHHESASRGEDLTPDAKARFSSETEYMLANWGDLLENDPAYNPNLTLKKMDFSIGFPPRTKLVEKSEF